MNETATSLPKERGYYTIYYTTFTIISHYLKLDVDTKDLNWAEREAKDKTRRTAVMTPRRKLLTNI